jgi:hypothetical protein
VDTGDGLGTKFVDLYFWPLLEIETHFLGHPVRRLVLITSTVLWCLTTMCSLGKEVVTIEYSRKGVELCRNSTGMLAALIFRVAITN